MRKIVLAMMVVLPQLLFADTECWVEEYPDHYVAECTGDEAPDPVTLQSLFAAQPALRPAPAVPAQAAVITGKPAEPSQREVSAQVEAGGHVAAGGQAYAEENAQRQSGMSKSRLNAAIVMRNRLLQQGR